MTDKNDNKINTNCYQTLGKTSYYMENKKPKHFMKKITDFSQNSMLAIIAFAVKQRNQLVTVLNKTYPS